MAAPTGPQSTSKLMKSKEIHLRKAGCSSGQTNKGVSSLWAQLYKFSIHFWYHSLIIPYHHPSFLSFSILFHISPSFSVIYYFISGCFVGKHGNSPLNKIVLVLTILSLSHNLSDLNNIALLPGGYLLGSAPQGHWKEATKTDSVSSIFAFCCCQCQPSKLPVSRSSSPCEISLPPHLPRQQNQLIGTHRAAKHVGLPLSSDTQHHLAGLLSHRPESQFPRTPPSSC